MYNQIKVEKLVKDLCKKAKVELTVPVIINGRLKNTLGMVNETLNLRTGYVAPTKIQFSKSLIENCTDKSIENVIGHEVAHYVVSVRTHENHGHDTLFREVCAELGTPADKSETEVEYIKPLQMVYKYTVYCNTCKKIVCGFYRKCKTTENIKKYTCKECGEKNLTIL